VALVVDASVGLKWVLPEHDSAAALALLRSRETLLMPDFWLNEATNVLWLQARRRLLTQDEARERLDLLKTAVPPTPTAGLDLHTMALSIGLAVEHSPYDALYVAFALAVGADHVVAADRSFMTAMLGHPDPAIAGRMLALHDWATRYGA
jgi:predicted nucleic acid-binding protein